MFNTKNPNECHQTTVELQERERQRDEKKEDFPFIRLSRKERKLLNAANRDWVMITGKNKPAAVRLSDLDFVRILQSTNKDKADLEVCEIRDRGKNYLMYLQGIEAQNRTESIRYWITTAIAVLALVIAGISLAAQLHLIQLPGA